MKMKNKTMVTAYITNEAREILKKEQNEGLNFSDWVDRTIKQSFFSLEQLKLKLKGLEKQTIKTKEEITSMEKYCKEEKVKSIQKLKDIPELEKKWLIESIELLKDKPHLLDGRVNLYYGEFKKRLTKMEFINLLEEIEKRELNGN